MGGWGVSCVSGIFREATPSISLLWSMVSGTTGTRALAFFSFFSFLLMHEFVCACLFVCTLPVCSNCGGQKRAEDSLELELQAVRA